MKRKLIYLLLLYLVTCNNMLGIVLNTPLERDPGSLLRSGGVVDYSGPYTMKMFIHIVRYDDGTGGQPMDSVNKGLSYVYTDFLSQNIKITVIGMDTIDSDFLCEYPIQLNQNGVYSIFAENPHSNAIDVYLLPEEGSFDNGMAENIPSTKLLIGGTRTHAGVTTSLVASRVWSHELGHCLGLYHTFHGTSQEEPGGCPELVDGSNSDTCGDHVSDTPADPVQLRNEGSYFDPVSCTWSNPSLVDANGQNYDPDETLIMSYTTPNCMSWFTDGQGLRMRTYIGTESILQACVLTNDIYFQTEPGTIEEGNYCYEAAENIYMGDTSSTFESGDDYLMVIAIDAVVKLISHNRIQLNPGTAIAEFEDGSFSATIVNDMPENVSIIQSSISRSRGSQDENEPDIDLIQTEVNKCVVYPNPTNGKFRIYLDHPTARIQSIKIFDANGHILADVGDNLNLLFIDLTISHYADGIYFCVVTTTNETTTFKIVKE